MSDPTGGAGGPSTEFGEGRPESERPDRLAVATILLEWWDATNPPDDHETRLARDTRLFLGGGLPDVKGLREFLADG